MQPSLRIPALPTPRRLIAATTPPHLIDGAVRSGRAVVPFRGVVMDATQEVGFLARVRAALATQSADAVVAMQTAAVLHRMRWLPLEWSRPEAVVHLVVAQSDAHRQRAGLRLHHRLLTPDDITAVQGIPCLSATRTVVELARNHTLPERLVVQIIDGALVDRRTTKEQLHACAGRFPGQRYVARARRLIDRSRPLVRSPQETTARLILEDAGIQLEVPIQITDDAGLVLAEGDFGIRRLLLWGEYDGYDPHTDREVFRRDRIGDRALSRRGWHVMRFVDTDMRQPAKLLGEWRQAIADAPARIAALDPRRSPEIAEAQRLLGLRQSP